MPLYEYYCPDCNTKFEQLRSISKADEAINCKECESERPTRMLSLFAGVRKEAEGARVFLPGHHGGGGCCHGGSCGCNH